MVPCPCTISIHRTRFGRHLEATSHVRRRHEPQHPLGACAAPRQAGRRVPRPLRAHSSVGSPDARPGIGAGSSSPASPTSATCPAWAGRRSASSSSPHCPPSGPNAGCRGSETPTCCSSTAATNVPVPLDARVRAGGPAAVAVRQGLGRDERREHGDDAADRCEVRRVAGRAGRPHLRSRRLLDLPAPERLPQEHPGRRGEMGGRRSASRPTPSTSNRPSVSSRAPSRWYPKASGRSSGHSYAAFATTPCHWMRLRRLIALRRATAHAAVRARSCR